MCAYFLSDNCLLVLNYTISCQRLSLTPLSYLWQRNQAELLSEMIAAGMEAILIKVAGIGLTTEHLGKRLSEMQPTLTRLVREPSFMFRRTIDWARRTRCMVHISAVKEESTKH